MAGPPILRGHHILDLWVWLDTYSGGMHSPVTPDMHKLGRKGGRVVGEDDSNGRINYVWNTKSFMQSWSWNENYILGKLLATYYAGMLRVDHHIIIDVSGTILYMLLDQAS